MNNSGAFVTMITPYLENGRVDEETVKRYVHWYAAQGCSGIFAVCQSSEIFYLSVEERVRINTLVYEEVQKIAENGGPRMTVVSSGHVADRLEDQAEELNRIYESGTDALILITNRLSSPEEDDDVWIANAEKLISMLPKEARLGLYECPYPYKRLVSEKTLRWCLSTGRFDYMKDTCCDAALIAKRLEWLRGSSFKLLNANCQTLLSSLRDGGDGYCGIMCNFHPALYAWLCANFEEKPELADKVQSLIGTVGFTEGGLPYPLTAKYHMGLCGIPTANVARNRRSEELTEYVKMCVQQMKTLSDACEGLLQDNT